MLVPPPFQRPDPMKKIDLRARLTAAAVTWFILAAMLALVR
jgi:cytochrome oxidase assembly protein ShyY1